MEFMCVFCESLMDTEQIICCGTYKGKITIKEFNENYEWVIN